MKLSKSELAKAFRVSLPTVDAWLRRGLPHQTRGSKGRAWAFDLADCVTWRIEDVIQQRVDGAGDAEALDLQAERAKLARAQREKLEREIATLDAKLIPADEVEAVWSRLVAHFRARSLALPASLAPVVAVEADPGRCFELLQEAVHEALAEMADYDLTQYRRSADDAG